MSGIVGCGLYTFLMTLFYAGHFSLTGHSALLSYHYLPRELTYDIKGLETYCISSAFCIWNKTS
jgi:hypothetical protein